MASGDVVGIITNIMPPAANPATPDIHAGGSTPAESIPVWDFDDSTQEYLDFYFQLEGYGGGGLTVKVRWMGAAAANECRWEGAIRRIDDDAEDVDTSFNYDTNAQTVDATAPSAIGEYGYATLTFTSGAQMDSMADGESGILRMSRDATNIADDMVGDAELVSIVITET